MTGSKLLSLLLALCCLFLCACGGESPDTDHIKASPIVQVIEALRFGNTAVYESAFPPDFIGQYREKHPDSAETLEFLLSTAMELNQNTCGKDVIVSYELLRCESAERSAESRFNGLADFSYTPDATETAAVTLLVRREGSYACEETTLTLLVVCIDGTWYLHPQEFGTALR